MGLEVLSSGFKVGLTGWGVVSQGVDAYVMMGGGGVSVSVVFKILRPHRGKSRVETLVHS